MLWNNLKQEEKEEKTKLDHFRSEQSTSHQKLFLLALFFSPVQWGDVEENGNFM